MRKYSIFILVLSIAATIVLISACSKNTTSDDSKTTTQVEQKTFTLADLKKYDGQNGNTAYVAVDGVVYDVTNAKNWKNGKHKNGITAGSDLTEELKKSPHGASALKGLPVVGKIQ